MELPRRQCSEMSLAVEFGPELVKRFARRRRLSVARKRWACDHWSKSEYEGGDNGDPQHWVSFEGFRVKRNRPGIASPSPFHRNSSSIGFHGHPEQSSATVC